MLPAVITLCLFGFVPVSGGGIKGKSKTELLTAIPARGSTDGENGYFLATPSIVEYLDYRIDGAYR